MKAGDKIKDALARDDSVVSEVDAEQLARVRKALVELQQAGIRILVVPNAVVVRAGRVEMIAEGDGRAIPANYTKVTISGVEITGMLTFAQVTAVVGEIITFEIKLGGIA